MDTLEFENRKVILQTAIDIRSMRLKLKEKLNHLASFAAYEFLAYQGCRVELKAYTDEEYTAAEIVKGTVREARAGNLIIDLNNGGDRSIPLDRIKDIALYKC